MLANKRHKRIRGQTRQEVVLVLLVCAVAIIALLSVSIPGVRRMWVGLGRGVIGYQGSHTAKGIQPETGPSSIQERK